jgi:hypothetical protein
MIFIFVVFSINQSSLIISNRFYSIEEQLQLFIFGASLAYALGRNITYETLHYPVNKPQPSSIKPINISSFQEYTSFFRVRVARELTCKKLSYFPSSIPLLVRNFETPILLYANHYLAPALKSKFGYDAVKEISRLHLFGQTKVKIGVIGVHVYYLNWKYPSRAKTP